MGIIVSISVLLFIFIVSNILVFCIALHEFFFSKHKNDDWVCKSQILIPENPNGKASVVLIHGFVGSPFDFKELAKELHSKGFRVVVPVVPGQGSSDFAYIRGKYSAKYYVSWLQDILDNEYELTGTKPFIVGFSMGGVLSVIMASKQLVTRLILIAPFFDLPVRYMVSFVSAFGYIVPVVPKFKRGKINDPISYSRYIPGSMLISISAFRVLRQLASLAEKTVGKINAPVFVLCSRKDQVASHHKIKTVLSTLENIEFKEYNLGNHILLYDYQYAEIVNDILNFLLL